MNKLAYNRKEAAEAIGVSTGTLANWALQKRGPKFYRRGRRAFYLTEDLLVWLKAHPVLTIDSCDNDRSAY
jgi:hypothetical protein